MADAFRIDFDTAALDAALDDLTESIKEQARPAAQAGAEVFYREVLARVPVSTKVRKSKGKTYTPGALKASIYQAYSKDNSSDGKATYHISWNARKAPHGHLVEYGTVKMAARPFIRPSFDAKQAQALEAAKAKLEEGMQKGEGDK